MSIRISGRVLPTSIRLNNTPNAAYTTWDISDTWNNAVTDPTYSDNDLTVTVPTGALPATSGQARSVASFNSGIRYVEVTLLSRQSSTLNPSFGLITATKTTTTSVVAADVRYWWGGGTPSVWVNGSGTNYGSAWNINDVLGILVNMNTNSVTFYKNGVSQGVAISNLPAGSYHILARSAGSLSNCAATFRANFGATPFAYPVAGATGILA